MAHKTGEKRLQSDLYTTPLEEIIGQDNEVRGIYAFVHAWACTNWVLNTYAPIGDPPYSPGILLKIYR